MAKNVSAPSGTPSFFTEVSRACGYGGRGERLVSHSCVPGGGTGEPGSSAPSPLCRLSLGGERQDEL